MVLLWPNVDQTKLLVDNLDPSNSADQLLLQALKRSQTFTINRHRIMCRLSRSDSDSAMPLYSRKSPVFLRNSMQRRSQRWKKNAQQLGERSVVEKKMPPDASRTSIDLALDLQASKARLSALNEDLSKLKELEALLEESKQRGEPPEWLQEEGIQRLLEYDEGQARLVQKTSRDIYRLRRSLSRDEPTNLAMFKEKMAFFTRPSTSTVPVLASPSTSSENKKTSRFEYTIDPIYGVQV